MVVVLLWCWFRLCLYWCVSVVGRLVWFVCMWWCGYSVMWMLLICLFDFFMFLFGFIV